MSDLVSERKSLKEEARRAKQAITDWLTAFEAREGRAPSPGDKEAIKHEYDAFIDASTRLKELKSDKKKRKQRKSDDQGLPAIIEAKFATPPRDAADTKSLPATVQIPSIEPSEKNNNSDLLQLDDGAGVCIARSKEEELHSAASDNLHEERTRTQEEVASSSPTGDHSEITNEGGRGKDVDSILDGDIEEPAGIQQKENKIVGERNTAVIAALPRAESHESFIVDSEVQMESVDPASKKAIDSTMSTASIIAPTTSVSDHKKIEHTEGEAAFANEGEAKESQCVARSTNATAGEKNTVDDNGRDVEEQEENDATRRPREGKSKDEEEGEAVSKDLTSLVAVDDSLPGSTTLNLEDKFTKVTNAPQGKEEKAEKETASIGISLAGFDADITSVPLDTTHDDETEDDKSSIHSVLSFVGHEMHPETPGAENYIEQFDSRDDAAIAMKDEYALNTLDSFVDTLEDGTGWSQNVDDDGNLFYFHHETRQGRFVLDMGDEFEDLDAEETVEGLGENFLASPWKQPSMAKAKKRAMEATIEGGAGSMSATPLSSFREFDRDHELFFVFVRSAGITFLVMTFIYLPTMVLCYQNDNVTQGDILQTGIYYHFSVGNIGFEDDSRVHSEPIKWFGANIERQRAGFYLSILASFSSITLLLAWIFFRGYNAESSDHNNHLSCSTYSVFVTNTTGLTLDAVMDHVREKLIKMEKNAGDDGIVDIVEAVPVYGDSEGIHEFLKHQREIRRVKRYRAQVKMYSDGSPMANAQKRSRAMEYLEWYEYFYNHHMKRLEEHHTRHHNTVDAIAAAAAHGQVRQRNVDRGIHDRKRSPLVGVFIVFDEAASVDRCLELFCNGSEEDIGRAAAAAAARDLWMQLDSDGDGNVSFEEFAAAMKKKMGRLSLPPSILSKMYESVVKVNQGNDGDFDTTIDIGGRKLAVERAPHPENVLWENMHLLAMPKRRACSRCNTKLLQLFVLIILTVAAALASSFVVKGTGVDFRVCNLHIKAAFHTGGQLAESSCNYIENKLSWARPTRSSKSRRLARNWDTKCDSAWPGSKFLVLVDGDPEDYQTKSSVRYADVTDTYALENSCYDDRCPDDSFFQCPCAKSDTGEFSRCPIDHIDPDSCSALEGGDIEFQKAAAVSCYCYFDVIEPNVIKHGVYNGLHRSLEESGTLCKALIWHSISLLRCNLIVTAFCASTLIILHRALPWLVSMEGHIFYDTKAEQLVTTMWHSGVAATIIIPILVHGDADRAAKETWQEWLDTLLIDTARSNAQLVYFLYLVIIIDILCPVVRYGVFLYRKRIVERRASNRENKGSVAMQADLDAIYRGKQFNVIHHYVMTLCQVYLAFLMGPGLPLLIPLTGIALILRYFVIKFLMLHYYSRPEFKLRGNIFKFATRVWASGVWIHLVSAWYIYGNRDLSRRITSSSLPFVEGVYECTIPLSMSLLLTVGIMFLLPKDMIRTDSDKVWSEERNAWVDHTPKETSLFTGVYAKNVTKDFSLPRNEYRRGWRLDKDRHVLYKIRPFNKIMKTWEVIGDLGLHSFRRSENRRYRKAIDALKKRLPDGHALLSASTAPRSPAEIARQIAVEKDMAERSRQLKETELTSLADQLEKKPQKLFMSGAHVLFNGVYTANKERLVNGSVFYQKISTNRRYPTTYLYRSNFSGKLNLVADEHGMDMNVCSYTTSAPVHDINAPGIAFLEVRDGIWQLSSASMSTSEKEHRGHESIELPVGVDVSNKKNLKEKYMARLGSIREAFDKAEAAEDFDLLEKIQKQLLAYDFENFLEEESVYGDQGREHDVNLSKSLFKRNAAVHPIQSTIHHFGDDEMLGEDFRQSKWVVPSKEKALRNNQSKIFKEGHANIWNTTISELNTLGTGIGAYFYILSSCTAMFFIFTVLSIPHLLIAHYGNYGSEEFEERKSLRWRLYSYSAGHHAYVLPSKIQAEMCGSETIVDTAFESSVDCSREWVYKIPMLKLIFSSDLIRARDASAIIATADFLISLILVLYTVYMQRHLRRLLASHSRSACDLSSFSVLVRGLPKDATVEEITQHFSNLYALNIPDWSHEGACFGMIGRKVSRLPEEIMFPSGIKGEKELTPVGKLAALNAAKPLLYSNTWIAECVIIHPLGQFIQTLQAKAALSRRLLVDRARIKKLSSGAADSLFFSTGTLLHWAEKCHAATHGKIEKARKELLRHGKLLDDAEHKCMGAFIVFNHEESVKRCLDDYSSKPFWHRLCFGQHRALRFRGEYVLKIVPADKPGNILWENINIGRCELRTRKIIALAVTFACVMVSFGLILIGSLTSQKLEKDIPTYEMCITGIPNSYGVESKVEWIYDDKRCEAGYHYITFTDADPEYKEDSWTDECTAPCVSIFDEKLKTCTGSVDGQEYEYSSMHVIYCYCIDKMSELVAQEGFYEGPQKLADDEVCGSFGKEYIRVQALSMAVSILVPVVNELLKAAIKALSNFQRNKTTTRRSISVATNTFLALFFNTAVLLLVVNGKMRLFFNYTMNESNELASSDYDEIWYLTTGLAIANIMLYNIIIPQIPYILAPPITYFKRAITGTGLTQFHLNETFEAQPFAIEQRCAQLLFTLACTLTFSSALPVLYPICFLSLCLSLLLDKVLLLRYFKKPIVTEGELGKKILEMLPWLALLHLANSIWVMSYRPSQGYHGEFNNQNEELNGVNGNIGGVFDAHLNNNSPRFYEKYSNNFLGFILIRLNRQHVLPLFILLVVLSFWYLIISRFLGLIIQVLGKLGICSVKEAGKALAAMRQFNPAYTEDFVKMVPDKWSLRKQKFIPRSRPHLDEADGWRVEESGDGHLSIFKINIHSEEGERLKTWEVVKSQGLHSYEIRLNEAYKEFIIAKDALLIDEVENSDLQELKEESIENSATDVVTDVADTLAGEVDDVVEARVEETEIGEKDYGKDTNELKRHHLYLGKYEKNEEKAGADEEEGSGAETEETDAEEVAKQEADAAAETDSIDVRTEGGKAEAEIKAEVDAEEERVKEEYIDILKNQASYGEVSTLDVQPNDLSDTVIMTERQRGDEIKFAKSKCENNEEAQTEEVVPVQAPATYELGVNQDVQMTDTRQLETNYDASDTSTGARSTPQNGSPPT